MGRFRRKILGCVAMILTAFLLFLGFFGVKILPQICILAENQVKGKASVLITEAISRQMETGTMKETGMISFEKDAYGNITALKTNMQQANRLKADVLRSINESILALDPSVIGVPLGNFLLPQFFGGRGPEIPVKILALRSSDANFTSHFTQAGINQTLHKLYMQVQVEGLILVLGRVQHFSAAGQMMVAETVIVGKVPHTFS